MQCLIMSRLIMCYDSYLSTVDYGITNKLTLQKVIKINNINSHLTNTVDTNCQLSLSEKRPYWEFFWFVFSCIRAECGKIRIRKNPNKDTFHAVYKTSKTSYTSFFSK